MKLKRIKLFLNRLGPGIITGAADDDPSGIATYIQTGAQFGFGQLWTAVFMYPFMTAVQEACARIGAITGKGLAQVIKEHYGKKILYSAVILLLIANTINIGANIGAMAASMHLIVPLPTPLLAISFTIIILLLQIFTSYKTYAKLLKWLALFLLCYPVIAIISVTDWKAVIIATFIPHIEFSFEYLFLITAVFGTTISPYMFFWQASEEVEEERAKHLISRFGIPKMNKNILHHLRIDNAIGMLMSETATWSIIVTGAVVLHQAGIYEVTNASDAAKAIEPLVATFPNSGYLAKLIFSLGIIGLGFLSIPVLSGSASYALSEALSWKEGLNKKITKAKGFYGIIIVSTLIGLTLNFIGINPFKILIYTAVINGVLSAPLLVLVTLISTNKKIMGEYSGGTLSTIFLWGTAIIMSLMAIGMIVSFVL